MLLAEMEDVDNTVGLTSTGTPETDPKLDDATSNDEGGNSTENQDERENTEDGDDADPDDIVGQLVRELMGDSSSTTAGETWFKLLVSRNDPLSTATTEPLVLIKPWNELARLHSLLLAEDGVDDSLIPPLPDIGGCSGEESVRRVSAYFEALLRIPVVSRSRLFASFLDGAAGSAPPSLKNGTDKDGPVTAIQFLLQPFDDTEVYIARREKIERELPVLAGESVVWQFKVDDFYDIDFSVRFEPGSLALGPLALSAALARTAGDTSRSCAGNVSESCFSGDLADIIAMVSDPAYGDAAPAGADGGSATAGGATGGSEGGGGSGMQVVHKATRYSTVGGRAVRGSFTCPADGRVVLLWDNSHSRIWGKRLSYAVESVTPSTMRAATEAADAAAKKQKQPKAVASPVKGAVAPAAANAAASPACGAPARSGISSTASSSGSSDDRGSTDGGGGSGDDRNDSVIVGSGGDSSGTVSILVELAEPEATLGGSAAPGLLAAASAAEAGSLPQADSDARGVAGVVRRTAAALLRYTSAWAYAGGAASDANGGGDGSGGAGGAAAARGVQEMVSRFEALEDELASESARRAQSGAQAKLLLAHLRKTAAEKGRVERRMREADAQLADAAAAGREMAAALAAARERAAAAEAAAAVLEERRLATQRERDLLQAERNVWQVARSGIQAELVKVAAALELERHAHHDSRRALGRAHEAQQRAELENLRLGERLTAAGGSEAEQRLTTAQEAARRAREEAEDARAALAEGEATAAELTEHKRLLVRELRAQARRFGDEAAAARADAEEARMMQRTMKARLRTLEEERGQCTSLLAEYEVKMARLRADRHILREAARNRSSKGGSGGGGGGGGGGGAGGYGGLGDGSSVSSSGAPSEADDAGELELGWGSGTGRGGSRGAEGGGACLEGKDSSIAKDDEGGGGSGGEAAAESGGKRAIEAAARAKLLSRVLVHLRERQQQLWEAMELEEAAGGGGGSAEGEGPPRGGGGSGGSGSVSVGTQIRGLEQDIQRTLPDLQARIRKLMATAAAGAGGAST